MPAVLTMASVIRCGTAPPHQGKVSISSTEKLTVQGKPVLITASVEGKTIAGCTVSGTGTTPCGSAGTLGAGSTSSKLRVKGEPVLLATLNGPAVGSPGGALTPTANQTKLTAT